MAPELATWQTQKVPNTISSKQPRTSPSSAKCGELHWEPFLALWSPSPLTQASCQPEAEVRLGPRGSREEGQRWLTAAVHTPAEQGWCRDCLPSLGQHFSAPWASRWGQVALLSNGMWVGMIWPLWAELVDDLVTCPSLSPFPGDSEGHVCRRHHHRWRLLDSCITAQKRCLTGGDPRTGNTWERNWLLLGEATEMWGYLLQHLTHPE